MVFILSNGLQSPVDGEVCVDFALLSVTVLPL